MKNLMDDLFTMSLDEIQESEHRFFINRARSVVIFDGSEFIDGIKQDEVDIYVMYNDYGRRPVIIAMMNVEGNPLPIHKHEKYKISYISPSKDTITYLRYDALGILNEKDVEAINNGFDIKD